MIEQDIRYLLTTSPTQWFGGSGPALARLVASSQLVTAAIGDRIRPSQARHDDKLPLMVYDVTGHVDPDPDLSGADSGWREADITLSVIATTYLEAQQLAQAVETIATSISNLNVPTGDLIAYLQVTNISDDEVDREGDEPLRIREMTFKAFYRPNQ